MRYPLIQGKDDNGWPKNFRCPVCKVRKVWEPHTFVSIDAGAMLMNRRQRFGSPSKDMDGYFNIGWHGAHDDGEGDFRDTGGHLLIGESVRGGQLCITVCSTGCLRKLFNKWVDDLEKQMKKAVPLTAPKALNKSVQRPRIKSRH